LIFSSTLSVQRKQRKQRKRIERKKMDNNSSMNSTINDHFDDPFSIVMISAMVIPCFFILVGSILLLWRRDHSRIRPTFPELTIISCLGYIILNISLGTKFTPGIFQPCLVQLWTIIIPLALIGNSYTLRALIMTVILRLALYKLANEDEEMNLPQLEDSIESGAPEIKEVRLKTNSFDRWLYSHREAFGKRLYISIFGVVMIIVALATLVINLTVTQYFATPDGDCESHVTGEVIVYAVLIIGYIIVFGFLLITIRNMRDSYGVKTQFKGIIGSWISILILYAAFSSLPDSLQIGHELYQAFSSYCYILPAFFELVYPLYKSYQLDWAKLGPHSGSTSVNTDNEEKGNIPTEFVELFQFAGASKENHDRILMFFSEYLEAEEFFGQRDKEQYLNITRMLSEMVRYQEEQKRLVGVSQAQLEFQYHAKSCIWYQRFLKEGAYFQTRGLINEQQSKDLQGFFENWTDDNNTLQQQTRVIFDEVEKNAVELLEQIKKGFFSSPCFYSYRQQVADATTMSYVVTQPTSIPLQKAQ